MSTPSHRLAALWFADIARYSRLARSDEDASLALVRTFQAIARREIPRHGGHAVKFMGNDVLAEFPSALGGRPGRALPAGRLRGRGPARAPGAARGPVGDSRRGGERARRRRPLRRRGERDWLEESYTHPWLASVREDPRYANRAARIGL